MWSLAHPPSSRRASTILKLDSAEPFVYPPLESGGEALDTHLYRDPAAFSTIYGKGIFKNPLIDLNLPSLSSTMRMRASQNMARKVTELRLKTQWKLLLFIFK